MRRSWVLAIGIEAVARDLENFSGDVIFDPDLCIPIWLGTYFVASLS